MMEKFYEPIALKSVVKNNSSVSYYAGNRKVVARYIRLSLKPEEVNAAAYEFVILPKRPETFSLAFEVQSPPTYELAVGEELERLKKARLLKMGIALALLVFFYVVARNNQRINKFVYVFVFMVGIIAWTNFQNPVGKLHTWEIAHYYLGAKYFKELGYKDLYRAIAQHEILNGRELLIQQAEIRDLVTYETYPGSQEVESGYSPKEKFDPSRWSDFSEDTDSIRRLFTYKHFQRLLRDHGYNATPLYTSIFGPLFSLFRPTHLALSVVGIFDFLLMVAGLAMIWMAFGPFSGALASLMLGLGEPWSILWTGNALGRYLWFFLFCLGFSLLRKNYRFLGSFFLTLSGCLVVFPLLFLTGVGGYALYRTLLKREFRPHLRMIGGIIAGLFVGLAVPLMVHSLDIYPQFIENIKLHAQNRSLNVVSLGSVLYNGVEKLGVSYFGGNVLFSIKFISVLLFLGLLYVVLKKEFSLWCLLPVAGILVFSIAPLSSYYYIWTACLVPACVNSNIRTSMLFMMLSLTNLASDSFFGIPFAYIYSNYILSMFLISFYVSLAIDVLAHKRGLGSPSDFSPVKYPG